MAKISNGQRALWSALITSLVAPLFASLIVGAQVIAGPPADFAFPARGEHAVGEIAIAAFAWAALPSTIAALGLVPYVLQTGTYGWLQAAVAGVLAFGAASIIFPFGAGPAMPFLGFAAGLTAVGMRALLIAAGILKS